MEIFIDQQYVLQANYKNCEANNGDEIYGFANNDISQLKFYDENDECLINIKKVMRTDKLVCQIQELINNARNLSDFRKLTSLSRYRQRQSFLRDIFIETYKQDGNTPDVQAILSKEYHVPSVLATNPKENHLYNSHIDKTIEILPGKNENTSFSRCSKQVQDSSYRENSRDDTKISCCVGKSNRIKMHKNSPCKNYTPSQISTPISSRDISLHFPTINHGSVVNFNQMGVASELNPLRNPKNYKLAVIESSSKGIFKNECIENNIQCPQQDFKREKEKVIILNKVLRSPWHPQQPNGYRPFRKKPLTSIHSGNMQENQANGISKDKNNNSEDFREINDNKHIDVKTSRKRVLKCATCQEVFIRRQDYRVHIRQHSSLARYSCGECQKTFSQLRNFKYHMSVHRGTKEFAATCPVCGKHFNDRGYLSNHMKIHRNRKEYKCDSCPKSFNQRVAFNMHVRIHTGLKPHVCEECGKAFSRKMLLKQHHRTHSGERPYACAHCDKRFADRSNMTLHLRLHTGVKPFSCTLCPKSFTKKHHLRSHLNFHTGAKPYTCPRCQLAFTQSSNMRTHFKKCTETN